jgi:hypothetical protein
MRQLAQIASVTLAAPKFWGCILLAAFPWLLVRVIGGPAALTAMGSAALGVGLFVSVVLAFGIYLWLAQPTMTPPDYPTVTPHDAFPETVLMSDLRPDPLENAVVVASGLNRLLSRWAQASQASRKGLTHAQDEMDRVIAEAEDAVLKIGNSFRFILENNAKQLDHATALLSVTAPAQSTGPVAQTQESLPAYIEKLTTLFTTQTQRLGEVAKAVEGLVSRQQNARDSSQAMDILLDSVSQVSKRVSVAALDLSVKGNGAQAQRTLEEFADHLRELSDSTRDAVRDMRRALDGIRAETAETGRALIATAGVLRKIAGESRVDAAAIQNGMRLKLGDASATVARLNALASDNRGHINRVIMSMQFHDITSQKLQKVKSPLLSGIAQNLNTLFDETRHANRGFTDGVDERVNTGSSSTVAPRKPTEGEPKKSDVELF